MIRENINIEEIAATLSLPYFECESWKCVVIGKANWNNSEEKELIVRYYHGPYFNEWQFSTIQQDELHIILSQTVGTISPSGILTNEMAFTFITGLTLIQKDIQGWRSNYMASRYNHDLEDALAILA